MKNCDLGEYESKKTDLFSLFKINISLNHIFWIHFDVIFE
jgi:hypothetical protein